MVWYIVAAGPLALLTAPERAVLVSWLPKTSLQMSQIAIAPNTRQLARPLELWYTVALGPLALLTGRHYQSPPHRTHPFPHHG